MKENSYSCGICGKAYPTIEERMTCEKQCYDKSKKEEAEKIKKRLEDEKNALIKKIETKNKECLELIQEYNDKFGVLRVKDCQNLPHIFDLLSEGWWI